MYLFEGRITLEDREFLERYLTSYPYKTSGLSFSSLYMWREINRFSWERIGDYLCIAASDNLEEGPGMSFLFPPLSSSGTYDPSALAETVLAAKERFDKAEEDFVMMLVPFHMNELFERALPGRLSFEADRPNFDYVYDRTELSELRGKKFHAKRNHLNYFLNNNEYEYCELTENDADEIMVFLRAFNDRKGLDPDSHEWELLERELRAMDDVVHNLTQVGYLTGAIRIDGRIEAFAIGGRLGHKTVTVHAEKANIEYRGLYQAINYEFARHLPQDIRLINREEDMGIAGLRKAKLSYNPVKMIEKYIIRFKKE